MSLTRTCSTCSAPLPDDAPEGALCAECSQAAAAQTRIMRSRSAPLEVIGDYEVLAKLGQGGMGAVYRARQVSLDRVVALKVLPNQFGDDPEFISRFQREARVAASLQHANLVRVYAAGEADGAHHIAMELIEGENLHQRMKRGRVPIPEALRICADVARGLQYGWERAQLVHRDIKPSNVYLSNAGEVKVGDLGLAKSLTANTTGLTQSGTMMGTPHYMSPEQVRGDRTLDFRADIYSLGCTLYELLTGQPPYPGSDPISIARAHLDAPLPAIMKALPGCPMPLARLVGRMLKKQPRERHASYDDLIADIENVMQLVIHGDATVGRVAAAWRQLSEKPLLPQPKPAAPRPATAVAPADKSKLPLYGAIAPGVLVLGVLAFVLTRPAKQPARRASVPRASAPASPAPRTVAAARADASISSAGWQPLMRGSSGWRATDGSGFHELKDGLLHLHNAEPNAAQPSADGAIRARIRFLEGTKNLVVFLRSVPGVGRYLVGFNRNEVELQRVPLRQGSPGRAATLGKFTLPKPLNASDTLQLELRAVGQRLTVLVNGTPAIEADDAQFTAPGRWGAYALDGWFESLEVQALPATP